MAKSKSNLDDNCFKKVTNEKKVMFYEVNFNFLIQEQKKLSLNSCFVEIVLKMLNCGYLAGNPAFDTPRVAMHLALLIC